MLQKDIHKKNKESYKSRWLTLHKKQSYQNKMAGHNKHNMKNKSYQKKPKIKFSKTDRLDKHEKLNKKTQKI